MGNEQSTLKIAFLGLGAMGSRMVTHLIDADYQVTVWNRSFGATKHFADKGVEVATTPADAVKDADVVISMVRDDEASKDVWLNHQYGALNAMKANAIAIESSTLTSAWVSELARTCESAGIEFTDAPVAGSRPQAEAAKLIYLVGSNDATLEAIQPVLSVLGASIHHCGPIGAGTTVKLAINALFGIQLGAAAELIGILRKSDLDLQKAFNIIGATPVCSPAVKLAGDSMIAGQYAPAFPIELVEKDFGYIESLAMSHGANVPVSTATRLVLQHAIEQGFGHDNITGVAQLYTEGS